MAASDVGVVFADALVGGVGVVNGRVWPGGSREARKWGYISILRVESISGLVVESEAHGGWRFAARRTEGASRRLHCSS